MRTFLLILAFGLWWPSHGAAHNLTVSVLSLRETSPGNYLTSWQRLQGVLDPSAAYLLLRPIFPEHCRFVPPRLQCGSRGLVGTVGFRGLGDLSSSAIIQLQPLTGRPQTLTFRPTQPQVVLKGSQPVDRGWSALAGVMVLGVQHILLGFDHLAFVLGLLWLVRSRRQLLLTVTSFTAGHSVTLALAALGYTRLPSAPVEAVIALSIAFLAVELVRRQTSGPFTENTPFPVVAALGFGLLHGLGFANALNELHLPSRSLALTLLGFNLGVELGQLMFVGAVLVLGALLRRVTPQLSTHMKPVAHYALGTLAMYWFVERVALMVWPGIM